jgi:hypothetical protein
MATNIPAGDGRRNGAVKGCAEKENCPWLSATVIRRRIER